MHKKPIGFALVHASLVSNFAFALCTFNELWKTAEFTEWTLGAFGCSGCTYEYDFM